MPAKNKALYTVMTCMRDVRKTADTTDNCFEPLKDTVLPPPCQPLLSPCAQP